MTTARCPVCRRPTVPEYAPFCSRGCKDRDLLKWLDEGYRISSPAGDDDAAAAGVDKPAGAD